MKSKALFSHPLTAAVLVGLLAAGVLTWIPKALAQAGPKKESGETVARPRKKDAAPEPELQKIPSKLNKKGAEALPEGVPTFRSDSVSVNVDVAVLDNKGRFIPGIPAGNFRILEDNVPQKINQFAMGEAPMTICMVIEFSNLYQQYWSSGWYETLQASYGFLETLKP